MPAAVRSQMMQIDLGRLAEQLGRVAAQLGRVASARVEQAVSLQSVLVWVALERELGRRE